MHKSVQIWPDDLLALAPSLQESDEVLLKTCKDTLNPSATPSTSCNQFNSHNNTAEVKSNLHSVSKLVYRIKINVYKYSNPFCDQSRIWRSVLFWCCGVSTQRNGAPRHAGPTAPPALWQTTQVFHIQTQKFNNTRNTRLLSLLSDSELPCRHVSLLCCELQGMGVIVLQDIKVFTHSEMPQLQMAFR